jgi:ABC-type uncharacterized transport system involved in gliding motility auxiliary subunit
MHRDGTSIRYDSEHVTPVAPPVAEESLVSDARAGLTPAQQVERKLVSLLQSTPLPVSRLENVGLWRALS